MLENSATHLLSGLPSYPVCHETQSSASRWKMASDPNAGKSAVQSSESPGLAPFRGLSWAAAQLEPSTQRLLFSAVCYHCTSKLLKQDKALHSVIKVISTTELFPPTFLFFLLEAFWKKQV